MCQVRVVSSVSCHGQGVLRKMSIQPGRHNLAQFEQSHNIHKWTCVSSLDLND
jgi:hypothetical protein